MNRIEHTPLILSASRTKDLVHRSPELLAELLLGKSPCRWGPHGPTGQVDPATLHTVVLWTKDPANLLYHQQLRAALLELCTKYQAQISLQITATGFAGSFIEPGIPRWQEVHRHLKEILKEGWINPAAVVYRYDPFLRAQTPGEKVISNASLPLFERLVRAFIALGITRVTTSRADAVHYLKVIERLRSVGLKWLPIGDEEALNLCRGMAEICHHLGADFSICCDPPDLPLMNNWGCIDARQLNQVKGDSYPKATEILHNRIGKQRPACQCTYSRDIGYSAGSATCFSGGYGCLYCYSQGSANLPDIKSIVKEVEEFDRDPYKYLLDRELPMELHDGGLSHSDGNAALR